MGGARRVSLQLPPNLEEPSRERALQRPVILLLPQAMKRLGQLCSVEELRLGKVVGRGEIRYLNPGSCPQRTVCMCVFTKYFKTN